MIYAVLGLIFLCGLVFSALIVQGVRAEDRLDRVLSAHAQERSSFLDAQRQERLVWDGICKEGQAVVAKLGNEAAVERNALLDRIQHPEVRQVEPGEVKNYDPPTDEAELAQVGQILYGNPGENGA